MKNLRGYAMLLVVALLGFAVGAKADLIWTQDFSNVSNWQVVYNPDSSVTGIQSDGTHGLFSLQASNSLAAFGPNTALTPLVPFVPVNNADYGFDFITSSLTGSASYDLSLDEFGANTNYLGTVFGVFPQGTFTGSANVALGAFSFDPSAVYLLPKLTLYTGNGDQTVGFSKMEFTVVPEPATLVLALIGFVLCGLKGVPPRAGGRR